MTQAQMERLSALMLNDLGIRNMHRELRLTTAPISEPARHFGSWDEAIAHIEDKQRRHIAKAAGELRDRINSKLDRDRLFLFAGLPFIVAELVWDYADSIINTAPEDSGKKLLSRQIRNLRTEFDRERFSVIGGNLRESEQEDMLKIEEMMADYNFQMTVNFPLEIRTANPGIDEDSVTHLLAVYQCQVYYEGLCRYNRRCAAKIGREARLPISDIMPESFHAMGKIIPKYCQGTEQTKKLREYITKYSDILATQMALVKAVD